MPPIDRKHLQVAVVALGVFAAICLVLAIIAAALPFENALLSLRGYDANLRDLLPDW